MSEKVGFHPEISLIRLRQELVRSNFVYTELPPLVYDRANVADAIEDRVFIASPRRYLLGLSSFHMDQSFQDLAALGAYEQYPIQYSKKGCTVGILRYRQTVGIQIETPGVPIVLNLSDGESRQFSRNPVVGKKTHRQDVSRIMNVYVYPNTAIADLAIEVHALQAAGIQLQTVNILDPKELDALDPSIRAQINTLGSLSLFIDYEAIRDIFIGIQKMNGLEQYIEKLNDELMAVKKK